MVNQKPGFSFCPVEFPIVLLSLLLISSYLSLPPHSFKVELLTFEGDKWSQLLCANGWDVNHSYDSVTLCAPALLPQGRQLVAHTPLTFGSVDSLLARVGVHLN